MAVRRRAIVQGLVQGVFFRESCRREALRRNVRGSVRNCADGTVEAHFEGEAEAVEAMLAWVSHGPTDAVVRDVVTSSEEPTGEQRFTVR